MLKTKTETKVVEYILEKTCDKCNLTVTGDDFLEFQEFFHIRICGGYGSVFGDGVPLKCDLCQHCYKELIDQYLQSDGEDKY